MDNVSKATELADLIDGYCMLISATQPQSLITKRAGLLKLIGFKLVN